MEVFPNPATNFLNFTEDIEFEGSNIVITDITGRVVFNSEYKKKIPLNHIESGTYLIQIITGNSETYLCKFLKL